MRFGFQRQLALAALTVLTLGSVACSDAQSDDEALEATDEPAAETPADEA
jgi:hypothetical protein